jgi:hypothetical protein
MTLPVLDPYALLDLDTVKLELGLPISGLSGFSGYSGYSGEDYYLINCINMVSATIEAYCDRKFKKRDYVEPIWIRYNGYRTNQYPIQSVTRIAYGADTALTVLNTSTSAMKATVDVTASGTRMRLIDISGNITDNFAPSYAYMSGITPSGSGSSGVYATTFTLNAYINTLSGWSGTLYYNCFTQELVPLTGIACHSGLTAEITYPSEEVEGYEVYPDRGIINGIAFPSTQQYGIISYTAGYDTIPTAVQAVALDMVESWYLAKDINGNLKSESLGDYSYSLGPTVGGSSSLSDDNKALLLPYVRVPVS